MVLAVKVTMLYSLPRLQQFWYEDFCNKNGGVNNNNMVIGCIGLNRFIFNKSIFRSVLIVLPWTWEHAALWGLQMRFTYSPFPLFFDQLVTCALPSGWVKPASDHVVTFHSNACLSPTGSSCISQRGPGPRGNRGEGRSNGEKPQRRAQKRTCAGSRYITEHYVKGEVVVG